MQRRRPSKGLIALIVIAALFLLATIEVGRAVRVMRRVNDFINGLDHEPDGILRAHLDGFSPYLVDYNPLVRNAALVAFRSATRDAVGANPYDLQVWWKANGATWSYRLKPQMGVSPELAARLQAFTSALPAEVRSNLPGPETPVPAPAP